MAEFKGVENHKSQQKSYDYNFYNLTVMPFVKPEFVNAKIEKFYKQYHL
jgi:hypothetical protein